jgi:hypothetical protein
MGDFRGGRGGTAGRKSLSGGALPSGDEGVTLLRFGVAVALAPAFRGTDALTRFRQVSGLLAWRSRALASVPLRLIPPAFAGLTGFSRSLRRGLGRRRIPDYGRAHRR